MIAKLSNLGLLGLASAASIPRRNAVSSSKGFNLVLQLADPSTDFTPPVQNSFVTSIHTGAGLALIGTSPEEGRIFYQNGTEQEYTDGKSTVITDGGTPPFPSGFKLNDDESGYATGSLDAGLGTPGVRLSEGEDAHLLPETFLACNEPLDYYGGKEFVIIKQTVTPDDIPAECRTVKLVPQCTELNELPDDATSSHEYVLDSPCFEKA